MIVVKIEGGLGNQLFQYAIGRNLAVKNNTDLGLDLEYFKNSSFRKYQLHHFNIIVKVVKAPNFKYIRWADSKNKFKKFIYHKLFVKPFIYKEKHFSYDKEMLNCADESYLEGFWQSEKYFSTIKEEILDIFYFDALFNDKFKLTIKQITNPESVALHVRRGDYLTNKNHLVLDLEYYEKAIKYLTIKLKNPKIFIFTDDIDWCKLNLKINLPYHYIHGNKDWEELKLMTLCNHFIIANSTFSWWGAYLNKSLLKIVICPKIWFPESNYKNIEDIFIQNWIKI